MSLHVNEFGLVGISVTVLENDGVTPMDISDATAKRLDLRSPTNRRFSVTPGFSSADGADGVLEYTWQQNDMNAAGTWKIQAVVNRPGGQVRTDIGEFTVLPSILAS